MEQICNILLIDDMFLLICSFISNVRELIKLELLSNHHTKLIRKNKWSTCVVCVKSEHMLSEITLRHVFLIVDLRKIRVTDESIKKLINCHTLNLSRTNITDKSVSKLINCHTLNLSFTHITDKSVSKLINCYELKISKTNITDKSVSKLIKCHTLNLSKTNVTD